jgi:tetratricopeptide (TPR) repeat protein
MEMNDYHVALELLNKVDNGRVSILKGKCLKNLNRIDEAIRCFDEAIIMDEAAEYAYYLKSECLYEKKEFESALDEINKATEIFPGTYNSHLYENHRNNILRSIKLKQI